ncbi:MAG: FAD-dependent oxidoreductase [Planctomycetes bacterium]|nr:FAD-dependent oxidoreductase [Planctomycetota bacterium]
MKQLTFTRSIPVRHEVDVFVAGGGPAGSSAAIAAARQGASVFIAEGEICFGGMGTSGGLPMLCCFSDEVNFLAGGVGREVHDRLTAGGGAIPHRLCKKSDLYIQPEALKLVFDELITAEAGIIPSLATRVIGIEAEGGTVTHVICQGKSGIFAVRCRAVVDATGDADICAWAGAEVRKGDERGRMQPGTMVSMWAGIDWPRAEASGCGLWKQSHRLQQAISDGVFTAPDPGMPGIVPTGRTIGNGNVGHLFGIDGTDERSLTAGAMLGRRQMREYGRYFREYLQGYEGIELCGSASRVGIRETRRIVGDYELVLDDFLGKAVFPDEIGRYCYPVDVHASTIEEAVTPTNDHFERLRLKPGESYGIPYRVLTPRGLANVLAAGRCVSADRMVLGSLRVMPGCYITGQAAGAAAAMTAAGGGDVHALAVPELQRRLAAMGAWLPNRNAVAAAS